MRYCLYLIYGITFAVYSFQVVVTVPLALLKSEVISFNPPLPKKKTDAIKRLGAGLIEKVRNTLGDCSSARLPNFEGSRAKLRYGGFQPLLFH